MQTTNLISTPNITGNIGSCETKSIEVTTKEKFFKVEKHVIITNSCSAEVIKEYDYGTLRGAPGAVFIFILLIIAIIMGILIRD